MLILMPNVERVSQSPIWEESIFCKALRRDQARRCGKQSPRFGRMSADPGKTGRPLQAGHEDSLQKARAKVPTWSQGTLRSISAGVVRPANRSHHGYPRHDAQTRGTTTAPEASALERGTAHSDRIRILLSEL